MNGDKPQKIIPPSGNVALEFMKRLFFQTEQRLIAEITRKRNQGYVDYSEKASLRRVQKIIAEMVDESEQYVPQMLTYPFLTGKGPFKGYTSAEEIIQRTDAETRRIIEQLTDNLLGEITEAAGTVYQSSADLIAAQNALKAAEKGAAYIGRQSPDIFRKSVLTGITTTAATGAGPLTSVEAITNYLEREGLPAFVDRAGHKWSLRDYGNMATRTTFRQAQTAAELTKDDNDLYEVIRHPAPCRVCAIYSGRVYSKSGTNPNYPSLAQAFGKVDPAGPDVLSNSYLNIHPNCLVPGGFVLAESVMAHTRRRYRGEVITLRTASGNKITVTPNHPILTDAGFIPAGALHEGAKIIEATGEYARFFRQAPNNINTPTAPDKIGHSFMKSSGGAACRVVGTAEQFHGDGIPDSEVDIVFSDSFGRDKIDTVASEPIGELRFPTAKLGMLSLLAECAPFKIFLSAFHAPDGRMGGGGFVTVVKRISEHFELLPNVSKRTAAFFRNFGKRFSLIVKRKKMFELFPMAFKILFGNGTPRLTASAPASRKPIVGFGAFDGVSSDAELLCNLRTGEALADERLQYFASNNVLVISELTHIESSFYDGYVYNLETKYGFYTYNNIVTHNCLCTLTKYTEAGKTPEQVQRMRDRSSFEKNPPKGDPRSKKEIEAYRQKERNRRQLRADIKEWEKMREALGDKAPATFATFQKHKKLNDEKYKRWKELMSGQPKPPKTPTTPKTPTAPKTPKAPKAPNVPTAPAAPKVPATSATPTAPKAPTAPKPKEVVKAPEPKPFVSSFKPAGTIAEAEKQAERFTDKSAFGALGVSYKGVSLDVANTVNKVIGDFYDEFDVGKFGGILAPAGNTKLWKLIEGASAGYSPIRNSFLLNRKTMRDLKTANAALLKERETVGKFLAHPERYDTSKMSKRVLNVLMNSRVSGRGTVPETIEEVLHHELGHALEKPLRKVPNYELLKERMSKYAPKISGYASDSFSEYVAESFASYRKGENIIDPEMVKAFESLRRKKP